MELKKIRSKIIYKNNIYKCFDAYGQTDTRSISNPLNYDGGLITRSWAKRIKDAAKEFVQKSLESIELKEDEETKLINLLSYDPVDKRPYVHLHGRVAYS